MIETAKVTNKRIKSLIVFILDDWDPPFHG